MCERMLLKLKRNNLRDQLRFLIQFAKDSDLKFMNTYAQLNDASGGRDWYIMENLENSLKESKMINEKIQIILEELEEVQNILLS
ncbi:hypothetical protein [Trichoplusia ni ascovirus 2c]|uniref:hypothetical protein n=1 Tax=Trichoplusia ni ascovirus 2c TaxID=328615 RepID=UPI0000E44245|nr:hypothetical protein TNAV2c_gp109 [Trichoplusia ni ascovirus 2c]ABF70626.1 hypothetical protein [Trichoplusia ni ascovirus 2c]